MREKFERHRADPSCAGCHALLDPAGLALEHFDPIGAFRANDHGKAIDASGTLDGKPFANARELGIGSLPSRGGVTMNVRGTGRLSRRVLLRGLAVGGASVAIPLPRLAGMLNGNGTAYANGAPLRRCFGTWFFGNGIHKARWVPASTGPDWTLSEQLAPLAKVKQALTVVSGMKPRVTKGVHATGPAGMMTGADYGKGTTVQLPSIDQLVADVVGQGTRFRSLEVGVSQASPNASGSVFNNISHRGPNAPNPPEFDARKIFARLFTEAPPSSDPKLEKLAAARRSVLDAVSKQTQAFTATLGAEDRQRVAQHLDGIRSLEQRLTMLPGSACGAARRADLGPDTRAEAPPAVNAVMADLVVNALACDLTRVFAFMFSYPAAHLYFRHLGQNADFHDHLCHGEGGMQPQVHAGIVYTMQSFAVFLEKLQATPHGAGTLLDSSCIYVTSCVASAKGHGLDDMPILVAGKAGGALRGNQHVRAVGDNPSKVMMTLANVMGANLRQFGLGECATSEELPAIRA